MSACVSAYVCIVSLILADSTALIILYYIINGSKTGPRPSLDAMQGCRGLILISTIKLGMGWSWSMGTGKGLLLVHGNQGLSSKGLIGSRH